MFSGFLYCADCGEKLYYSVTNNYKREQAYFFCSAYRKNSVDNLQKFIEKVKRITQPMELAAELVHEFIEKIIVHAPK
ncbi:MAG: DUF4368 domain-containing protein [Eubacteriales bacterium]